MVNINDFSEERECIYKGEKYRVRDNGAICRCQREGMSKRKLDEVWTFGKKAANGYVFLNGEGIHRIVAVAFHGDHTNEELIVDHIDTNRCNNRPENLRWLTRLENTLNNPITRKKIILICGSVEAFLSDPSLLSGHESLDPNFSWMRAVTQEEARNSLARWSEWVKKPISHNPYRGAPGNWIFDNKQTYNANIIPINNGIVIDKGFVDNLREKKEDKRELTKTQSLTSNAIQLNWKYPATFPCCPQHSTDNQLETYMANLENGKVFCTNQFGDSTILAYGMPQPNCLWVMANIRLGWKTHAFTKITFEDNIFYHENKGVYDVGDEPEHLFEGILKGEYE